MQKRKAESKLRQKLLEKLRNNVETVKVGNAVHNDRGRCGNVAHSEKENKFSLLNEYKQAWALFSGHIALLFKNRKQFNDNFCIM